MPMSEYPLDSRRKAGWFVHQDVIDVADLALIAFNCSQSLIPEESLKQSDASLKRVGDLLEMRILNARPRLPPIVEKSVPLQLDDLSICVVDEPVAMKRRLLDELDNGHTSCALFQSTKKLESLRQRRVLRTLAKLCPNSAPKQTSVDSAEMSQLSELNAEHHLLDWWRFEVWEMRWPGIHNSQYGDSERDFSLPRVKSKDEQSESCDAWSLLVEISSAAAAGD
jgi:hypothetical protein